MDDISIRLEKPGDYKVVEELTRAAFDNPDRVNRSKIECPLEHYMVHSLRKKDGIMALNFVAEMNGHIVGHIIFSSAHILQPNGSKKPVLNFGPLSVLPQLQRKGIGSALMNHSIKQAKKLGYGAIVFFGHPEYYPRFGFVQAKEFCITNRNGRNSSALMAMELQKGHLRDVAGKFIEADIYDDDLNRKQAQEFDKRFRAV